MKFNTAPVRLKRNSCSLTDLQAEMAGEFSPCARAPSPEQNVSAIVHYTPNDAAPASTAHEGGSWPKVSKRRTSGASSMSLREVSEALAAAANTTQPPLADALDDTLDLQTLDALVSEELLAEGAPHSSDDEAAADHFVGAVFGGMGLPSESMTELSHDELLSMMLQEPTLDAALDEPAALDASVSSSPTSVSTLFGAALSGGASPRGDGPAEGMFPPASDAFGEALPQKLEAAALPQPAAFAASSAAATAAGKADKADNSRNAAERKEWTPEEDEVIRQSVLQYGARWRRIAAQLPGRSDDAVRNRWNRLKGDAKAEGKEAAVKEAKDGEPKEPKEGRPEGTAPPKRSSSAGSDGASKPERVSWTKLEDATILQSVAELGHKWNKLAERLPGRTDHAIRNRFHRLQTMLGDKPHAAPLPTATPPQPQLVDLSVADGFVADSFFAAAPLLDVPLETLSPFLAVA